MKTISTSKQFSLNLQDLLKGLIIAALTPALVIIQQSIAAGSLVFDWKAIGMAAISGGLAYLIKNFFTPSQTILVEDKPSN